MIYTAELESPLTVGAVLNRYYTYDLQAYIHFLTDQVYAMVGTMSRAMETLQAWMFNSASTQLIWLGTPQQLSKLDICCTVYTLSMHKH